MQTVNPYEFMEALSLFSKDGDIIITDSGATLCWTMQGYKIRHKVRLFSAFNHSTMGYALPAAIGAQIASPASRVVAIMGDGAIQMNIQELETVVFNKLPIKIFMFNNRGYGMIKQTQDTWMKSKYVCVDEASGLGFPEMTEVAAAYGLITADISCNSELWKIENILNCNKPIFCNVNISPNEKITPKLVFGKTLEFME